MSDLSQNIFIFTAGLWCGAICLGVGLWLAKRA